MECFLCPRRIRTVLQCISFGAVLLWILLGSYTRHEGKAEAEVAGGWSARHLLSTNELGGKSQKACEALDMYYDGGAMVNLEDDQCSKVHKLNSNFTSCDFVECVDGCSTDDGLFNYLGFIYCVMPSKLIPLAMVLLFLWLIFLFIFLGATAEEYFCPALTVISSILRLSQNVAGVTLLALGNGAPDIFSAFAAVNQDEDEKASLAVGALFGAGIFVTTIVVGAVTIAKPFTLTQRPFLRDIIFYIFAVYWTFYRLWTNTMTVFNAIGFVILYVFYVVVVIVGRIIFQRWKKWRNKKRLGTGDMPRAPAPQEGEEMDHSEGTSSGPSRLGGLAGLSALLPGTGVAGSYRQSPAAMNGHISVQADDEEEEAKERDEKESDAEPRLFRISSVGSSEFSASGPPVSRPVIHIQGGSVDEGSPLFPRMSVTEQRRAKELAGASLPPLLPPQKANDSPRLGSSVDPHRGYGAIPVGIQTEPRSRSPSPNRQNKMRKTISGALDMTEGVGAAFGIPHVPELWEEVSRGHARSRSRSNSYRARARTRSTRSTTGEGTHAQVTDDHAPLLGPTLTVPGSTRMNVEDEDREGEEGSESEGEDEMAPVIQLQTRKRRNPLVKLLLALWPFGESFKELGFFGKAYEICKSPAGLLLTLTVPVIDTNEDDHNWNKWLNILHCVTAPVFVSLITKQGLINIGGVFPVWTLLLLVGTALGIVVACTSRNDKPPIYHCIFAWVGFAVAVVWIYSIANEIVNLLQAFGIVIKLSDGILGLTLLAWGNSIGDAVSNVTMAKQGFPRMAIGACFGGPLLNILLGIGIASVVKSIRRRADGFKFPLIFTQVELIAALFLMCSLMCTLITVSVLKFRFRMFYGIFLILVYIVFLTVAILAEANVFQIYIQGVITHKSS